MGTTDFTFTTHLFLIQNTLYLQSCTRYIQTFVIKTCVNLRVVLFTIDADNSISGGVRGQDTEAHYIPDSGG